MFAPKRLLIKGGKLVNHDGQLDADIFIEGEKIKLLGLDLVIPRDTKTIDARGKWIIPGGINAHTHLMSASQDVRHNIYTGSQAALSGGTTTIIDFIHEHQMSILEVYDKFRSLADQEICCDYGLGVAIGSLSGKTKKEMEHLALNKSVNAFMLCSAYKQVRSCFDLDDFLRLIYACQKVGALAMFHIQDFDVSLLHRHVCLEAESKITDQSVEKHAADISPEVKNILKVIAFASHAGCPLNLLQVQSIKAAEVLRKICDKGCRIYGEAVFPSAVSEQSKSGSQFNYSGEKPSGYLSSPALSEQENTTLHLMGMLSKGFLQNAGIDKCHVHEDDDSLYCRNCTNMIKAIEYRMSLIWEKAVASGNVTPSNFVAMTSTNAAKMYNLYPDKGYVKVGSDADLVVWDPDGYRNIPREDPLTCSNDFKVFEGIKIKGKPTYVIYRGRVVVENERPMEVKRGSGSFIPTLPFSPFIYLPLKLKQISISVAEEETHGFPLEAKFHLDAGDEAGIDQFCDSLLARQNKSQKEEKEKDVPQTEGISSIKSEKEPGATKIANNFRGNNKSLQSLSETEVSYDNKSDTAAGDKKLVTEDKEKGNNVPQKRQFAERKPSHMDEIFNTGPANQDVKVDVAGADVEQPPDDLLLAATTRSRSNEEFRRRPPTRSGARNLLDSTFSLSGAQIDDDKKSRPTIRVQNPPGGRSSGIWYS